MSLTFKEFKSLMLNIPKELLVFEDEPLKVTINKVRKTHNDVKCYSADLTNSIAYFHFYYSIYKEFPDADALNSISLNIPDTLVGNEYEFYKKLGVYFTMMGIKYLKC